MKPRLFVAHGGWYCRVILSNGSVHQAWGPSPGLAWWALADRLAGRTQRRTNGGPTEELTEDGEPCASM